MSAGRILLDHSKYSRENLGEGVYGGEFDDRCTSMAWASKTLLHVLWAKHPAILRRLEADGKQVVHP